MTLLKFAAEYCISRDISQQYQQMLVARMQHLEQFHGEPVKAVPINYDLFNRWLIHVAKNASPRTVRSYRACLLALLNGLADHGIGEHPISRRIRRIKMPALNPRGWTIEEIRQLLATCKTEPGWVGQIPAAKYWESIIRSGYDSGLRRGDLLRLTLQDVRGGHIVLSQGKTGSLHVTALHPSTVALIESTVPPDRHICWPWPWRGEKWYSDFKLLVARAGLVGSFKFLRRSSGSYAQLHHGRGPEHLGHSSPAVFRQHYEIQQITHQDIPLPPEL